MARRFFGRLVRRVFQPVPVVEVEPPVAVVTPVVTDSTPNAFTLLDTADVPLSTLTSASMTVSGLGSGVFVAASVSGAASSELQKNGGVWQTAAVSVQNGDTVAVRHVSSASSSTLTNTVLTIGGVSDTFTSTTASVGGSAGQSAGLLLAITKAV